MFLGVIGMCWGLSDVQDIHMDVQADFLELFAEFVRRGCPDTCALFLL